MTEAGAELPWVERTYFAYRFPRYGTDERKRAWTEEYKKWWRGRYEKEVGEAEYGWLTNPHLAESVLSHHNLSPRMIEAAVNSSELEVSQLAVRQQKLSIRNFALALSHPLISVFDLFDAEELDPKFQEKYVDDQLRLGMTGVELAKSFKLAKKIVASRSQVFTI